MIIKPEYKEPTKTCPCCKVEVPEHVARCPNKIGEGKGKVRCGHAFPMSCEGCGREVVGRVFCRECVVPGRYHWDRAESKQPSGQAAKQPISNPETGPDLDSDLDLDSDSDSDLNLDSSENEE